MGSVSTVNEVSDTCLSGNHRANHDANLRARMAPPTRPRGFGDSPEHLWSAHRETLRPCQRTAQVIRQRCSASLAAGASSS